ncbi:hypothetical protein EDB86DRAFT_1100174 [Lactarius hatsudake]|nr:hypothetical protein EDB86DRAFT_1100174 [Lactarius hatsudake]
MSTPTRCAWPGVILRRLRLPPVLIANHLHFHFHSNSNPPRTTPSRALSPKTYPVHAGTPSEPRKTSFSITRGTSNHEYHTPFSARHFPPIPPLYPYTPFFSTRDGTKKICKCLSETRGVEARIWTAALCATQIRLSSVRRVFVSLCIYCDQTNHLECLTRTSASFWLMYAGLPSFSSFYHPSSVLVVVLYSDSRPHLRSNVFLQCIRYALRLVCLGHVTQNK